MHTLPICPVAVRLLGGSLAVLALLLRPAAIRAQDEQQPAKAADGGKGGKIPAAKEVLLPSGDLKLAATYYPGAKGKETVPVVLLHGFKGSRKDYAELAPYLQKELGCAVLVPDLRGHGESASEKLQAANGKMPPKQFTAMVDLDMHTVLLFLLHENNGNSKDGKPPRLNLNKLCLVGADMGAILALETARRNWNTEPVGKWQLGKFTKGLVLISPEWSFKTLSVQSACINPGVCKNISVLILVGKENQKAVKDADRINKKFAPYHPLPPPEKRKELQSLFLRPLDTKLQGTKMLNESTLGVPELISQFIACRLIGGDDAKKYEWVPLRADPYKAEEGE